ncbi:MAG TPA: peptidase MA family metallohydrolase [Chloroflexota bacterium]|nr:peptidase MA family metallohydrolase [Chloroflexota bacterium]
MEGRAGRLIGRRLLAGLLLLVVFGWVASPGLAQAENPTPVATAPAMASGGAITVLQSTARADFPRALTFHLQARSSAQIVSIRIAYQIQGDPVTYIARVDFSPASTVDATYTIDLTRQYYPPGITVQYRWQISDLSGAHLVSQWYSLSVTDPRFFWRDRTSGPITLHWYQGDDSFADAVLATANQALTTASRAAGQSSVRPVQIYLYANSDDFRGALGPGADQWVGGQTFPLYRVVLLLTPPDDVSQAQRSVAHEMTHMAIDTTAEDPYGALPTWLSEGMAMVAEGPMDPVFVQALNSAARSGRLLSIQSLSGNFPSSTEEATLAYAESGSIVDYFIRTYGQQKLAVLIRAFRAGSSSDEAFRAATGLSTLEFQHAWEASIGAVPSGSTASSGSTAPSGPSGAGSIITRIIAAPVAFLLRLLAAVLQLFSMTKS